eukprot:Nk52_evm3s165 gene=Nk52_evmTU3s165
MARLPKAILRCGLLLLLAFTVATVHAESEQDPLAEAQYELAVSRRGGDAQPRLLNDVTKQSGPNYDSGVGHIPTIYDRLSTVDIFVAINSFQRAWRYVSAGVAQKLIEIDNFIKNIIALLKDKTPIPSPIPQITIGVGVELDIVWLSCDEKGICTIKVEEIEKVVGLEVELTPKFKAEVINVLLAWANSKTSWFLRPFVRFAANVLLQLWLNSAMTKIVVGAAMFLPMVYVLAKVFSKKFATFAAEVLAIQDSYVMWSIALALQMGLFYLIGTIQGLHGNIIPGILVTLVFLLPYVFNFLARKLDIVPWLPERIMANTNMALLYTTETAVAAMNMDFFRVFTLMLRQVINQAAVIGYEILLGLSVFIHPLRKLMNRVGFTVSTYSVFVFSVLAVYVDIRYSKAGQKVADAAGEAVDSAQKFITDTLKGLSGLTDDDIETTITQYGAILEEWVAKAESVLSEEQLKKLEGVIKFLKDARKNAGSVIGSFLADRKSGLEYLYQDDLECPIVIVYQAMQWLPVTKNLHS